MTAGSPISPATTTDHPAPESRATRIESLLLSETDALLRYFSRRAAVDDAADLLGETMLAVWRRAQDVPDGEEGVLWMYGVARRVLSTHHRSLARRARLSDRLREQTAAEPPLSEGDDEITEHLRHLIRQLPPLDRDIIGLIHWEGFTLEETARILGRNASTIRTRYSRLRTKLKNALDTQQARTSDA